MPGSLVGRRTIAAVTTLAGFLAGLAVTLAGSELLARGLTRLGAKLGLSEGLLGLLAALGADSPELSSAVVALVSGAGSVGVGVVVGSNLFNIAALLGLSAIVAGGVRVRRAPALLDAGVALLLTSAAAGLVAGAFSPAATVALIVPLAAGYVAILARPPARLRVARAVPPAARTQSWLPAVGVPLGLVAVVGGSFVMVREALAAQAWLHVSSAVTGSIVLAALTSLPNLYVALHFARHDRGSALFSSAMNSNGINLVGGLILPALLVGPGPSHGSLPNFLWLSVLTLVAVIPLLARGRLGPGGGAGIIAIYAGFVVWTARGAIT